MFLWLQSAYFSYILFSVIGIRLSPMCMAVNFYQIIIQWTNIGQHVLALVLSYFHFFHSTHRMFYQVIPYFRSIRYFKEDQIGKDLEDIEGMQTTIQVISFIVCAIVPIIILYQIFKRCRYIHLIVKYCFLFFLILRILRGTHRMDLFVEFTNLKKGNTTWTLYTLTGYYPKSIRLS